MADGSEFSENVIKFLDKEFGEDFDSLKEIERIIKDREELQEKLIGKISACNKDTKARKAEVTSTGKQQLEQIEDLLYQKNNVQMDTEDYFTKSQDILKTLKDLNDEVEQINCLQVYLSWVAQISHLSSEIRNELSTGHLEIATEFFYNLTEISGRLQKSSCQNLVDYAINSQEYWFKVLSDMLTRDLDETLLKMKWPFATGISSPVISDGKEDISSKFRAVAKLILKLDNHKIGQEKTGTADCLVLTKVLVKPFQKRFAFHFYGPRRTNNLEKPEWFFTQILNWIRDHSPFLENFVQPIIDESGYLDHYIQHEFIQALLETCVEKIKTTLPQIIGNESLFSHLIDETILFDGELRSLFDYPSNYPGCTSVLLGQPYLDHWIDLERKCAIDAVNSILTENEAFNPRYIDPDMESSLKVPSCVEDFVEQISLITEKYRSFGNTEAQLKFLDLQLFLLDYFISKLEEIGEIESASLNYKCIYALLNGSQFLHDILSEWTEQVFFIQISCARSQKSLKTLSKSVRLDDSVCEEQHSDANLDSMSEQQDSYLEKGLFDDVILSLEELIRSLSDSLLRNIERELKSKVKSYKDERWHCYPSSKDLVTQMLSTTACDLLMSIKNTLQAMNGELCPSIFAKVWPKYAQLTDKLIFEEVVLESHFNEGGASQLKFDMIKNLFVLFEGHTSKPDTYFKLIKESCVLLNLLPGSAILLKDVLTSSEKASKDEGKKRDALNALLDINVKDMQPGTALKILNSRIDLPKI